MQKRGLVVALVLGVLFISLSFASAFSFSDFFKEFYGKITGKVIDNSAIPSGLVGYWSGDGNALDSSGNGINGVWTGTESYNTGKFGQAFNFDGTVKYVNFGRFTQIENKSASYTISFWIKSTKTSGDELIYSYDRDEAAGNDNSNFDTYLIYHTSSGIQWGTLTGCDYSGNSLSSTNIGDGNWHHVVTEVDSATQGTSGRLYLDGSLIFSSSPTGPYCAGRTWNSMATDYGLRFGVKENIGQFTGSIDEISVFNRALSASEVQQLYSATPATVTCTSFTYSDWSACTNNRQTRTVATSSPNGCTGGNPILNQSCTTTPPTCTENWTCSSWSECTSSQQTRICNDINNCNTTSSRPALTQTCNSVQNISTPSNITTQNNTGQNITVSNITQCPSISVPSCMGGTLTPQYFNGCLISYNCVLSVNETQNCAGCLINNICVPIGYRFNNSGTDSYCDVSGVFAQKKNIDNITQICQNSFECSTNLCSEGQCVAASGLKAGLIKLICGIVHPLDGNARTACINEYIYGIVQINCTESDWNYTFSPEECPSSEQQIMSWTKTGTCNGGVSHPSSETVSCTSVRDLCIGVQCTNGQVCNPENGECTDELAPMSVSISGNQITSSSSKPLKKGMTVNTTYQNGKTFSAIITSVSSDGKSGTLDATAPNGVTQGTSQITHNIEGWKCIGNIGNPARGGFVGSYGIARGPQCRKSPEVAYNAICVGWWSVEIQSKDCDADQKCEIKGDRADCVVDSEFCNKLTSDSYCLGKKPNSECTDKDGDTGKCQSAGGEPPTCECSSKCSSSSESYCVGRKLGASCSVGSGLEESNGVCSGNIDSCVCKTDGCRLDKSDTACANKNPEASCSNIHGEGICKQLSSGECSCLNFNKCGNVQIDSGEDCDGTNLNGQTCSSLGFENGAGTLSCNSDCTFDTSACQTSPSCNDGIKNGDETGVDCGGLCDACTPTCGSCERLDENGICVADTALLGCNLLSCLNGCSDYPTCNCNNGCISSGCGYCGQSQDNCGNWVDCSSLCSTSTDCGGQICSGSCINGECA